MFNRDYYNHHWAKKGGSLSTDRYLIEKTEGIKALIPSEIHTILDVGCGDGAITNDLARTYNATGMDISIEALKFVSPKVKALMGNAATLPFNSECFDLVFSSEMIEHLPYEILKGAVKELKRVSREYILLSVPNDEQLRKRYIKCLSCGYEYHIYCHFNSFNLKSLKKLFFDYDIVDSFICGVPDEPSLNWISFLKNKLANSYFYIDTEEFICPQCNNRIRRPEKSNMFHKAGYYSLQKLQSSILVLLNRKAQLDWLVVLFRRKHKN